MIKHTDFDNMKSATIITPYKLPCDVKRIIVSYDGGRLSIEINGKDVYEVSSGTRDCSIEIDNGKPRYVET